MVVWGEGGGACYNAPPPPLGQSTYKKLPPLLKGSYIYLSIVLILTNDYHLNNDFATIAAG